MMMMMMKIYQSPLGRNQSLRGSFLWRQACDRYLRTWIMSHDISIIIWYDDKPMKLRWWWSTCTLPSTVCIGTPTHSGAKDQTSPPPKEPRAWSRTWDILQMYSSTFIRSALVDVIYDLTKPFATHQSKGLEDKSYSWRLPALVDVHLRSDLTALQVDREGWLDA